MITAYSARESLDVVERFPRIDGIVLDAGIRDMTCEQLVTTLKKLYPRLPIVVIAAPGTFDCPDADHTPSARLNVPTR